MGQDLSCLLNGKSYSPPQKLSAPNNFNNFGNRRLSVAEDSLTELKVKKIDEQEIMKKSRSFVRLENKLLLP